MSYLLKIQIDDELLREVYFEKVTEHNKKIMENSHPDSGFDLFMPRNLVLQNSTTTLCDT